MEKLRLICNGCGEERRFDDELLLNRNVLLTFIEDHGADHGSIDLEFALDGEESLYRIDAVKTY